MRVLAYATNVNRSDLLTFTNQNRRSAGLSDLLLNDSLNQAAQSKANHMIANNYWAHTAPDGTTPWYFFDQAGYDYVNAGENLAYGFIDSSGVVQGWMDSPGHRANIMGDYKDVGFGFASSPTYQGGENTVVVAMYGTPRLVPAPAPVVQSTAPSAPPATPAASTPVSNIPPAPAPAPEPALAAPVSQTAAAIPTRAEIPPAPSTSAPDTEKRINTASDVLKHQQASSWPVAANMAIIVIAGIGFITTHMQLIEYAWQRGLHWAGAHPLTDAAVITSVSLLVMSSTIGYIR